MFLRGSHCFGEWGSDCLVFTNGVKNIETETIFKLEEVFGEPIIAVVEEVRAKRYGKKV
ncbi:MAG: hypothetical protein Q7U77_07840 [Sediminibacterium sp.]|uniref:hypothetical protein n=1 Tax=Sediminibacterium sp. TaxID=1917865 RepID=UPI002726EF59|nr:hypothetical protein [Sediminibacterium sp.]MDO8996523.1 hypothetical protein [Sediminibacterium sp.]